MVKKLVVFLFVVCMGVGSLSAQLAKTCFTNMPDSLSPLLTAVNRADFIDFLESKMKAEVTNRFGGKSEMTELAPDYIRIQMTVILISILPTGKNCHLHLICHQCPIWTTSLHPLLIRQMYIGIKMPAFRLICF